MFSYQIFAEKVIIFLGETTDPKSMFRALFAVTWAVPGLLGFKNRPK